MIVTDSKLFNREENNASHMLRVRHSAILQSAKHNVRSRDRFTRVLLCIVMAVLLDSSQKQTKSEGGRRDIETGKIGHQT